MQPTQVWIDLEDTVITSWAEQRLMPRKISKIRKWLRANKIREVRIWSFAIYNQADMQEFEAVLRDELSVALDCIITQWPSVQHMQQHVYEYEHIQYDSMFEFMQLNGKAFSFITLIDSAPSTDKATLAVE